MTDLSNSLTPNGFAKSAPPCRFPNLFLIGAAKAGTSFLASRLGRHREILRGIDKEADFFSSQDNFAKGLDWYQSNFPAKKNARWVLDASTGYTRFPEVPGIAERVYNFAPDAKLIYLMRHPVDRAYSHFIHRWTKELHPNKPFLDSFEVHIEGDPMCINSSDYRLQIEQYLEYFRKQSILCLFNSELQLDPERILRRVCDFLDVSFDENMVVFGSGRKNDSKMFLESRVRVAITGRLQRTPGLGSLIKFLPSQAKEFGYRWLRKTPFASKVSEGFSPPPMGPDTRKKLIERFDSSNRWIADFTDADLSAWKY